MQTAERTEARFARGRPPYDDCACAHEHARIHRHPAIGTVLATDTDEVSRPDLAFRTRNRSRTMSYLGPQLGTTEARFPDVERTDEAPTDPRGTEELSDAELEDVLGGLERIHFPKDMDVQLDT